MATEVFTVCATCGTKIATQRGYPLTIMCADCAAREFGQPRRPPINKRRKPTASNPSTHKERADTTQPSQD